MKYNICGKILKTFGLKGEVKVLNSSDFNRFVNHRRNIYFADWSLAPFEYGYPTDTNVKIPRPVCLDKMLDLAKKLSKDIPFVRVDFYVIYDKIYFGELTFYPEAGIGKFNPDIWNIKLGECLKI